jgi:hypothetical protein
MPGDITWVQLTIFLTLLHLLRFEMIKICKNCHYHENILGTHTHYCKRKIGDLVTGEYEYCRVERELSYILSIYASTCGKTGRFYVSIGE